MVGIGINRVVDDGEGMGNCHDGLAQSIYFGRTITESYAIINTW